jgi:hypothetical protein
MRISAKIRSQAALICAVAASTRGYASYYGICAALGLQYEAADLAYAAYDAAALKRGQHAGRAIDRDTYVTDALAETMLRTGVVFASKTGMEAKQCHLVGKYQNGNIFC